MMRLEGGVWSTRRKGVLVVCLAIAALLWFCDWTDYSLPGTWADWALPVVGIVAAVVALRASRSIGTPALRSAVRIAAVLTLLEGSVPVAAAALMAIVSPAGIMLVAFYPAGEEQTSVAVSPDGLRVAEEYYNGGGLLGDGVMSVRVKYRLMPLLERDVYRGIYVGSEHVTWEDNDTLHVPDIGGQTRIRLGLVR